MGNHVFYAIDLPPHSIMTVTVKPKNDGTNLSLYGYQIGVEKVILPEDEAQKVINQSKALSRSNFPPRQNN